MNDHVKVWNGPGWYSDSRGFESDNESRFKRIWGQENPLEEGNVYEDVPAGTVWLDDCPADWREAMIVTRHEGAVEWLAQRGITGKVFKHVEDPAFVAGKIVVGALPLHLAALTAKIGSIDMPALRADQRGKDLTPAEMDAAGAVISWYIVSAVG